MMIELHRHLPTDHSEALPTDLSMKFLIRTMVKWATRLKLHSGVATLNVLKG